MPFSIRPYRRFPIILSELLPAEQVSGVLSICYSYLQVGVSDHLSSQQQPALDVKAVIHDDACLKRAKAMGKKVGIID